MRYPLSLEYFGEVVSVDTEFHSNNDGNLPQAICIVMHEWRAQRATRYWIWGRQPPPCPAVLQSPSTLLVAYTGTAELVLFQAMGWPLRQITPWVLDLNVEMRNYTNGRTPRPFIGLFESAREFNLPYLDKSYKDAMRDICIRGNPQEILAHKDAILRYCDDDVAILRRLCDHLIPHLSLPHALFRGQYVYESAAIEYRGNPVNLQAYRLIQQWRKALREVVASKANVDLGEIFDGDILRKRALASFVRDLGLSQVWPRTPKTGEYRSDGDTLRALQNVDPKILRLHEVLDTLNDLKAVAFAIGDDARNRFMPGLWGTITGRNSPKAKLSIFHRSRWWRNLVAPPQGYAWAYLDYAAQEFFIAAVLANDSQAIHDYTTGDVYTTWGRSLGLLPDGPEVKVKSAVRDMLKVAVLALIYGIQVRALALILGVTQTLAWQIKCSFEQRYGRIAMFVQAAAIRGGTRGLLRTRLDWRLHIETLTEHKSEYDGLVKPANVMTINTLRDWLSQSSASDMLHTAVVLAGERGVNMVGTLHDAIMIEAPLESIDHAVSLTTQAMQDASMLLLFNADRSLRYPMKVDATVVRYPEHYVEGKSQNYWQHLRFMLRELSGEDLEHLREPVSVASYVS